MHSCRSDGREDPKIVCANNRLNGYDFMAMTDHCRYYPSLEAMESVAKLPTSMLVVPGEEVQLGRTSVHIINFGGTFSVNGMVNSSKNFIDKGDSLEYRSLDGKAPNMLTYV